MQRSMQGRPRLEQQSQWRNMEMPHVVVLPCILDGDAVYGPTWF